jgi:hypothetical protein
MNRPADSIAKLADYLWWLLPVFLKKKDRAQSLVAQFCEIWGERLDEARETLTAIIPELLAATASGDYLDLLARQRQVFRGVGESDESLRARVLAAHTIKRRGGTIPGMIEGLEKVGYAVEVSEPNKGTSIWSRFVVRVLGWDGVVADQSVFYQTVRELKPAHTRAHVESAILMGTWDDWEPGEETKPLDIGQFDAWQAE